ncbi:MAG: HAMP domain-containing protein [Candidatus Omnitrophica bacterium]|nr:HAMP domain-containing protein [Candidatus Omnitrophota bacterium]
MRIGVKIGAGYLLVGIIILLVSILNLMDIYKINKLTNLAANQAEYLYLVSTMENLLLKQSNELSTIFRGEEDAWIRFENLSNRFKQTMEELSSKEEGMGWETIADRHTRYVSYVREAYDQYLDYRPTDAKRVIDEKATPLFYEILTLCDQSLNLMRSMSIQYRLLSDRTKERALRMDTYLFIVGFLMAVTFGMVITRRIVKPISNLRKGAEIIGEGNLGYRIGSDARDEIGELSRAFNDMARRLGERTREIEAANKELESFSYSVSHDLRAPLRAIDGFSNMLLDDYRDRLDDEGKRLLNVVRVNTKKMGQLIDDILHFSRMGRKEITITEIDMDKLVSDVYAEIKASAPERRLQLNVKPLAPAYGDPSMLRQVVSNLLSNAVKFTRQKDAAVIEVGSPSPQSSPRLPSPLAGFKGFTAWGNLKAQASGLPL